MSNSTKIEKTATIQIASPLTVLIHNLGKKAGDTPLDTGMTYLQSRSIAQKNVSKSIEKIQSQSSLAATIVSNGQKVDESFALIEDQLFKLRHENHNLKQQLDLLVREEANWKAFCREEKGRKVSLLAILQKTVDSIPLGPFVGDADPTPFSSKQNLATAPSATSLIVEDQSRTKESSSKKQSSDTDQNSRRSSREALEETKAADNQANLTRVKSQNKRSITSSSERMTIASIPEDINEPKMQISSEITSHPKAVPASKPPQITTSSNIPPQQSELKASPKMVRPPSIKKSTPTINYKIESQSREKLSTQESATRLSDQVNQLTGSVQALRERVNVEEEVAPRVHKDSSVQALCDRAGIEDDSGPKVIKELANSKIVSRVAAIFEQKSIEQSTSINRALSTRAKPSMARGRDIETRARAGSDLKK